MEKLIESLSTFSDVSDEREDGEIVDDFEDISDHSIPSCGKSDYSQDLLRELSLSSISDSDGARGHTGRYYIPARKRHRHHETYKYHRRHKRRRGECYSHRYRHRHSSSSSSDSGDEKFDKLMLRQLKEAVRINVSSHQQQQNSLKSRLKVMIDPNEAEAQLVVIENNEKSEIIPKDTELDLTFDKELAELRSAALKTAMLKKHNDRKKRKEMNNINEVATVNNNKENAETNIPVEEDRNIETEIIDEDVDVMRAMLLASMSKKITSVTVNNQQQKTLINNIVTSTPNINNIKEKNIHKPQKKILNKQPPILLPSVKPLIINLNSDSESEVENPPKKTVQTPIDKSVEEFLRKQREEFEAKQEYSNETKTKTAKEETKILDKSIVKLLPKQQQREYHLLKQKLLAASCLKKKVRRLSLKYKNGKSENGSASTETAKPPNNLKKTIEDLQIRLDGRLQMKGKYKELAPLIQKINQASDKKKVCEEDINKLLKQLQEARTKYAETHQTCSTLVKQLIQAKENVDRRTNTVINPSTNLKCTTNKPADIKSVKTNTKNVNEIKAAKEDPVKEVTKETIVNEIVSIVNETPIVSTKDENQIIEETIVDQYSKQTDYTKYISPLDNRNNRASDPLQMLCPYELFGVCKDPDCKFNHCS